MSHREEHINEEMKFSMRMMHMGLMMLVLSAMFVCISRIYPTQTWLILGVCWFLIGSAMMIFGSKAHGRLYNMRKKLEEEKIMKERLANKKYRFTWDTCTNVTSHEEFAKSGFIRCSLCGYPTYGISMEGK